MADADGTRLSPDEAFSVLGNETRIEILRALGAAGETMSFSELYDAVDVDDSGQFNYHLDKLVDHFVAHEEAGYYLREPGNRVVEAVLSGAVTDDPVMERTRVGRSCHRCGAPVTAAWRAGSVELYCTDCEGTWSQARGGGPLGGEVDEGYLGRLLLPPAGLRERDPGAAVRTAWLWTTLEVLACASGICPRCSAPVDRRVHVCEDHESGAGVCARCDHDYAVTVSFHCVNCVFSTGGSGSLAVIGHSELLAALIEQGFDPLQPADTGAIEAIHEGYTEEIFSTDPLDARFVFSVGDVSLTVRVDEELHVTAVDRDVSARGGE